MAFLFSAAATGTSAMSLLSAAFADAFKSDFDAANVDDGSASGSATASVTRIFLRIALFMTNS